MATLFLNALKACYLGVQNFGAEAVFADRVDVLLYGAAICPDGGDGGFETAIDVEVDHDAVSGGLEAGDLQHAAISPAFGRGENSPGHLVEDLFLDRLAEDGCLKSNGAINVDRGDVEPDEVGFHEWIGGRSAERAAGQAHLGLLI
ncbi:MAG: hypothetical protein ABI222_09740 [Opitutaceae bacterium]